MLPVLIVCHAECEPSGYLCAHLDKRKIPYKKVNALSEDLSGLDFQSVRGMIFMGGPYSVYDDHDWLDAEIALIQRAVQQDMLMMGVCFGAQLISKALGADVCQAENMETGWHTVEVDTSRITHLPELQLEREIEVFEWHEDMFTLPEGAIPVFTGKNHENQGYVIGRVFAMQFHMEITETMVHQWLERYEDCIPKPSLSVQNAEQITENFEQKLKSLHKNADIIYDWWLSLGEKQ
jgi:GMP synthase-like glutamine amidotransferase